jgi:hypothetical protein
MHGINRGSLMRENKHYLETRNIDTLILLKLDQSDNIHVRKLSLLFILRKSDKQLSG